METKKEGICTPCPLLLHHVGRVCCWGLNVLFVCALQETAINIGYACSLITDDMTQFQMQGSCLEVDKLEAEGRVSRKGSRVCC